MTPDFLPASVSGALAVMQVTTIMWIAASASAPRYRVAFLVSMLTAVAAVILISGLPVRSAGLALTGISHAIAYASLLAWFAMSLRPGRESIVTGLARRIRKTMPAKVVRYTRQVTFAWCIFFAAQLTVSTGLFLVAPRVWFTFVSLLNLPLLVLMILAEFGCRRILFRNEPRTSLIGTLLAMRHTRLSGSRS